VGGGGGGEVVLGLGGGGGGGGLGGGGGRWGGCGGGGGGGGVGVWGWVVCSVSGVGCSGFGGLARNWRQSSHLGPARTQKGAKAFRGNDSTPKPMNKKQNLPIGTSEGGSLRQDIRRKHLGTPWSNSRNQKIGTIPQQENMWGKKQGGRWRRGAEEMKGVDQKIKKETRVGTAKGTKRKSWCWKA